MSTAQPNIPQILKDKKQWLVWRLVQKQDEPKPRKVPFYVSGVARAGEQGADADRAALCTFDDAWEAMQERGYTGLGFAVLPGDGLVALDFDHCVHDGQILDSRIETLIEGTYAEISPSGTGLRAFFLGEVASAKDNAGKEKRVGGVPDGARLDGDFDVEVFGHNGFVTITGNATSDTELWGLQDTVAPLTDTVKAMYRRRFGEGRRLVAPAVAGGSDNDDFLLADVGPAKLGWTIDMAREYLFDCSADVSRDEWLKALMAIHYEFDGSDEAFDLVDEWSATGENYGGKRDVEGRWRSFGRRSGGAPITGKWLLQWRREQMGERKEDDLRLALASIHEQLAAAEDFVAVQTKVVPEISKLLLQHPLLELEAYTALASRAKAFSVSLTKQEFKKMVKVERPPAAASVTPLTEFGNTERMLRKYGDRLMFVADTGTWYVWDKGHWRRAMGGRTEVEHFAKDVIRDLPNEAANHPDQGEFFGFCSMSQRAQMVAAMVKLAESDHRVCVPASELDKHRHLLGVKNGVVNLQTGDLLEADRLWRITMQAGCEYNPGAKCPLFDKVLKDAFFDDCELAGYMMRAFGYAIQGDPTKEMMFIPFGNGANGKSTVFNTVRKAFGDYGRSADASSFVADKTSANAGGPREDLLRLRGARLVYVNEPDEGGELREGSVKAMTGGDTITARGINAKHTIEIEPSWTIFMPTNHKPIIKGTDNGIWRRMGLIPFERDFRIDPHIKKDEAIKAKLLKELPGVLAAVIRAGIEYQKNGISTPKKVAAATDNYRDEMDLLSEWLEECCDQSPSHEESVKELWSSWEGFAKARGQANFIRSSTALGRKLESRFPAGRDSRGRRVRKGLRIVVNNDLF